MLSIETRDVLSAKRPLVLAPILLFLVVYILPLGYRPLLVPDEARYAEIAREMVASGDWVVPRLGGLRYFEKPVLGHWLNAMSIMALGENEFATRFPSALAVGLTALAAFLMGRRFGNRTVGLIAATVYLTFVEVFAIGTTAILDSFLALFLSGAISCFFVFLREEAGWKRRAFLAGFGFFCACAFLVKGFLAFAVPVLVIAPHLLYRRRFIEALRGLWLPLLLVLVIVLPWAVAIHVAEPTFWHYFFWVEHVHRFISASGGQHPEPVWFYVPAILVGSLPWLGFLPAAFSRTQSFAWSDTTMHSFLLLWFWLPLLFFSACRGKLYTYVLPCFFPLSLLLAGALYSVCSGRNERVLRRSASALIGLFLAVPIGVAAAQLGLFNRVLYGAGESHKVVLAVVMALSTSALGLVVLRATKPATKVRLYAAILVPVYVCASMLFPGYILEKRAPREFLLKHAGRIVDGTIIISRYRPFRAISWYYHRTDAYLFDDAGELRKGVVYEDSRYRMIGDPDTAVARGGELRGFIESKRSHVPNIVVMGGVGTYADYRKADLIPEPDYFDSDKHYFIAEYLGGVRKPEVVE